MENTPNPPKVKDNGEPNSTKKRGGKTSDVWDHFTKKDSRCVCNYCGKDYAYHSKRIGTSSLWNDLRNQCKKYLDSLGDKKQKVLHFPTNNEDKVPFSKERCRKAVAKFVIKDEQPFSVVEGEGFRELVTELQPKFGVPSRVTVARDVYRLFCDEKIKLKKEMTKAGQRLCLTTDCWTSSTQMSFMCLTAHYIDSDWCLRKRIINFCQIANHKGETIGKVIEACLLGWGIENVFTITVDNASANDVAVAFVKRRVNAWSGSILDGEYMHLRCGAHIVNLIVCEGLKEMDNSIVAIRNCVRYIRSSPARLQKFKSCVEKEKIDYKGWLVLDVPTRWNSTFMMLDVALKFEKAFERYGDEDDKFSSHFEEKENEKKRIGPPSSNDWECASIFVKFLSTFYEVTLKFSGTLHVTSNNFFHELCEIDSQLSYLASNDGSLLHNMAKKMKGKYDKYWGDPDHINPMLFLAIVLDPRYKLKYLKFCFESLYDSQTVAKLVLKVEQILHRMYNQYSKGGKEDDEAIKQESPPKNDSTESQRKKLLESFLQQQQMDVPENMTDIDRYLVDESINPKTQSFDVVLWWKVNANRYNILSMIARDVLAIPISTVASESAFSTSGRILDSFRSSLSPKMVEALVCTQSWLKGNNAGIQLSEFLDEISSYDFLEEDKLKENATLESERSKSILLD